MLSKKSFFAKEKSRTLSVEDSKREREETKYEEATERWWVQGRTGTKVHRSSHFSSLFQHLSNLSSFLPSSLLFLSFSLYFMLFFFSRLFLCFPHFLLFFFIIPPPVIHIALDLKGELNDILQYEREGKKRRKERCWWTRLCASSSLLLI